MQAPGFRHIDVQQIFRDHAAALLGLP